MQCLCVGQKQVRQVCLYDEVGKNGCVDNDCEENFVGKNVGFEGLEEFCLGQLFCQSVQDDSFECINCCCFMGVEDVCINFVD